MESTVCGICGAINMDGAPVDPNRVRRIADGLKHRGPDDAGLWCHANVGLGHRRLSIIDLSPAGHQPMSNEDSTVWITYNGEIYNFQQLKSELQSCGHVFRSRSDTEVIIHGYEQWGEKCWEKLDGIFSFGLYDVRRGALFLVRDPLGVKPLFYHHAGHEISFSSEPLALFGPGHPSPPVEAADLDAFFTFNYLPAPRTGLLNVRQLPAGSWLCMDQDGVRQGRYWRLDYGPEPTHYATNQVDLLCDLLKRAVRNQMVSDAPLGLFLSGGLDSFAVAQAAKAAGSLPLAVTLGFSEARFDETEAAQQYVRSLGGTGENVRFTWTEQEIIDTLAAMSELLADASCFPFYQLCRFASRSLKVCLSGDGGDELWAGYDTYRAARVTPWVRMIPSPARRAILRAACRLPSDDRRYGWRMVVERLVLAAEEGHCRDHACFRRIMSNPLKTRLYDPGLWQAVRGQDPVEEYVAYMAEVPQHRSYLTACQHADLMFHLPSILAKVDRMSMAHGLEIRVPLLSKSVVEFSANLPDEAKLFKRQGKRILRDVLRPFAPPEAMHRPKAGFLPPVDKWFREPGPMQEVFADHLERAAREVDGLNWREVKSFWRQHQRREVEGGFVLLGILQFINWSAQCRNAGMA
ncbi:MAG: asparagine synthase (glutamine-hydrolyzing) [Pseudomonadota bacterium]